MIKKTIEFTDYNGVERKEEHWFHLNDAEIMEMELSVTGGLAERIQRIVDAKEVPEIIKTFKELILKAYGQKSPDGRRFIKNDKLREEFSQTEAYSKLFMKLATDADAAAKFVNGIIPANSAKTASLPEKQ